MPSIELPSNAATNGWYNILPAPPPARQIEGEIRVATAVIGAGFTGLSVARKLAEHCPSEHIALVEAERVGYGTSGRNSGFVLDSHFMPQTLPFPDIELARAQARLCGGGRDILKQLVRDNQIECHWHDWGKLWISAGPGGARGLEQQRAGNEALDIDSQHLDVDELEAITGTRFYTAGLKSEGTALVNPAALCRGLAQTLPANVTVYEQSPVSKHDTGAVHHLHTQQGKLIADRVVFCTNVFSPLLGLANASMAPIVVYASLSRVMDASEQEALGGDQRGFGLLPAATGGSTIQRTPDGRLLIRNSLGYGSSETSDPQKLHIARGFHAETIAKRWPALAELELEHTWGGCIGLTRNEGHVFGEVRTGVWASIGCNGANVARGTMSGSLLADLMVGQDSALLRDQQRVPSPAWMPPEPVRGFFARRRINRHKADVSER